MDEAAAEKAETVGVVRVEVKVGVETAAEVRVGEVMAEVEMVGGGGEREGAEEGAMAVEGLGEGARAEVG